MKFLCKAINYFFKNCAAFFININRHKNYIEFKRNFIFINEAISDIYRSSHELYCRQCEWKYTHQQKVEMLQ